MIGYRDERFRDFGWAAARLDDVANFIPARITAFFMVLITFSKRGWRYLFRYGRAHKSPNAGYPEAALAGILNLRFGGPAHYHGELVHKPYIGETGGTVTKGHLHKAQWVNIGASLVMLILIGVRAAV